MVLWLLVVVAWWAAAAVVLWWWVVLPQWAAAGGWRGAAPLLRLSALGARERAWRRKT